MDDLPTLRDVPAPQTETAVDGQAGDDTGAEGLHDVAVLGDRIEADLDAVDRTLERVEARTYGRCRVCDAVIDDALLEADPILAVCPAHVTLVETTDTP